MRLGDTEKLISVVLLGDCYTYLKMVSVTVGVLEKTIEDAKN